MRLCLLRKFHDRELSIFWTSSHIVYIKAFAATSVAGRFRNRGLGILQGLGMIDVDAGLAKQLQFGERFHLRFEASPMS